MVKVEVVWFREKVPHWKTKIIMWGGGTPYSHVALIGKASDGNRYIFHSVGVGVLIQRAEEYENSERWVIRRKELELHCSLDKLEGYALGERGKDYSETQLALIVLAKFFKAHWALKLWHWLSDGARERICSETVAAVIDLWGDVCIPDLDFVTPKDLEDILQPEVIPY